MELEQESPPASENADNGSPMGIARAVGLLAMGLLINILCSVCLSAAGFRSSSALSVLVSQVVSWALVIWAALRMGHTSLKTQLGDFSIPRRLVLPVVLASVGAAIVLPQIAGLVPAPDWFVKEMNKLKDMGAVPLALCVGVIAPIAEETFFRGLMLRGFLRRYTRNKAIWISATLFAVAHLNPWQAIIGLPMGVAVAYIFIRTGSIWPGVLSHATLNLTHNFVTSNLLRLWGYAKEDTEKLEFLPYQILAIGVIALVIGGMWVVRELRQQDKLVGSMS